MLLAAASVNAEPAVPLQMSMQTSIETRRWLPPLKFCADAKNMAVSHVWGLPASGYACGVTALLRKLHQDHVTLNDGCWVQGQLSRRNVWPTLQMPCSSLLVTGRRYRWREATPLLQHSVRKRQTAISRPLKQWSAQPWTGCFKPWSIQQTPLFWHFHIAWYDNAL